MQPNWDLWLDLFWGNDPWKIFCMNDFFSKMVKKWFYLKNDSFFVSCANFNQKRVVSWALRSGLPFKKISILRVMKKKKMDTSQFFMHRGPKKAVEHDSDIHFDLTWAKKKKRNGFLCQKQLFFLKKWDQMKYFGLFFYRNIKYQ